MTSCVVCGDPISQIREDHAHACKRQPLYCSAHCRNLARTSRYWSRKLKTEASENGSHVNGQRKEVTNADPVV